MCPVDQESSLVYIGYIAKKPFFFACLLISVVVEEADLEAKKAGYGSIATKSQIDAVVRYTGSFRHCPETRRRRAVTATLRQSLRLFHRNRPVVINMEEIVLQRIGSA